MALALNCILSLALGLLLPSLWGGALTERPLLRALAALACFAALTIARRPGGTDRRMRRLASVPGLLFACFTAWGAALEALGAVPWKSPLYHLAALLLIPAWTAALCALWTLLARIERRAPSSRRGTGLFRRPALTALLLLLCWTPCFLAIFPGNFVYDTGGEYDQCAFGFNSAFPRLHSWLNINVIHGVYGFTHSFTAGVAVFTLLHMLGLALLFAWMLKKLRAFGLRPWLLWLCFAWCALFPTVQMLSVSPIRDLMFSGFLTATVFYLLLMLRDSKRFWKSGAPLGFGLCLALTVLSRENNGGLLSAGVLVAVTAAAALSAKKGERRGAAAFAAASLACFFGLSAFLGAVCRPFERVHTVSGYAALTQPLARSYERDEWSDYEKRLFAEYFDVDNLRYVPNDADPSTAALKGLRGEGSGLGGFVRLWIGAFRRHPGSFLDAWLENTRGLWQPNAVIDGYVRSGRYEGLETAYFYYTDQITGPGSLRILLPRVHDYYENIGTRLSFERIPVLRLPFSIGFHFWLLLGGLFYWAWRGKRRLLWVFAPLAAYTLLSALCPLMLVRYFAALFLCFPLLLCALLQPGRMLKEEWETWEDRT